MQVGPLTVELHRTIRVAEGRAPANLPPSLGLFRTYKVSDHRDRCPETWEDDGVFVGVHDTEALWVSFRSSSPVAVMVGAGGVNAVDGEKLGTKLSPGNYLVCPPQPWLDGWKGEDGSVYQFVATPFKQGEGLSVGEQVLGAESKTGGVGIAVFRSKEPLKAISRPFETSMEGEYGGVKGMSLDAAPAIYNLLTSFASKGVTRGVTRGAEMGVGKGGKITQKIYPDPHGIEVWEESPAATAAVYLVTAADCAEITGEVIPSPATPKSHPDAPWFGLKDEAQGDVAGTGKFTGLKSAFPGDTGNVVVPDEEVKNIG